MRCPAPEIPPQRPRAPAQVWFQNKRQRTKNGAKPTAAEVLARSQSAALQTANGGCGGSIQDAGEVLLSFAGGRKEGESNGSSPTSVNLGKRSLGMQSRRENNNTGQMPVQYGMMQAFPGMAPWSGAAMGGAPMAPAPMFFPAPMGRMAYAPMNGMMPAQPYVGKCATAHAADPCARHACPPLLPVGAVPPPPPPSPCQKNGNVPIPTASCTAQWVQWVRRPPGLGHGE